MPNVFAPCHFAQVPLIYWPILALRLLALQIWCKQTGRNIMFTVTTKGYIIVKYVEDDQDDFQSWCAQQNLLDKPHLHACNNADGSLEVNPIVTLIARAMERMGHFERWIWVRTVARIEPAIRDSS